MTPIVSIADLHAGYGAASVLFGVSMDVHQGQVTTLMGRNGMGKTTTIRCLMGLLKPTEGKIRVNNIEMAGAEPYRVARAGVGLVPEGRHVFPSLTVSENLRAIAAPLSSGGWSEDRIYDMFPRLAERKMHYGFQLSGGEQQMLAIGRALMTNPNLLVLDEATEGLAPLIRQEIWAMLKLLKSEGLAILLIDKNLAELSVISDQYFVLEKGHIVWNGSSGDLDRERDKVEGYLHL